MIVDYLFFLTIDGQKNKKIGFSIINQQSPIDNQKERGF